jgi:hypothetical protein
MRTTAQLLAEHGIKLASTKPGRHYATCPHCSHNRSKVHQAAKVLGVTIEADGKVHFGCNHCGWTGPQKESGNGHDREREAFAAAYDYIGFQKVRYPKGHEPRFRVRHRDKGGDWRWGAGGANTNVLYHLPEIDEAIANDRIILVVEGEKDVDNAWRIGIPATCNSQGASEPDKTPKWKREHSEQLRGADIVVIPDHDAAGYAHAEAICRASLGIAKRVRQLVLAKHWPECPKGGDLSDWLAAGHTREQLDELIEGAPLCEAKCRAELEAERKKREAQASHTNGGDAQDPAPKPPLITAQPFKWPDPATIPPRQFLFGRHYQRKTVGATIGSGGRGKTTLSTLEMVSMACGRDLLTGEPTVPLCVWHLNGEEEQDELDRRVAAVCQHYGISEADCGGRLFVQAVEPLRFATLASNVPTLNRELLDRFEAEIRAKGVDVVMLDPLISFHSIAENDNGHMDLLIKGGFRGVAVRTRSAIELLHHPGKAKPGEVETVVENARGASAIIHAVRSARVLNFMTPQEAEKLGISEDDRRLHIRVSNGKANRGPLGKATWFKLAVENLPNGDEVACSSPWKRPDPFFGITPADMYECRRLAQTGAYRLDSRSHDWIGYAVAEKLGIDVVHGAENDPRDLARLKQILHTWFKNKVFATEKRRDNRRKERTFVIPGPWQPEDLDPEEFILQ